MLSNLETDSSKLLQIILVGQTEMRKNLALPALRQLRQRISIVCHLSPLTRAETEEYFLHRLEVAGNRGAVRVAPEAFDRIHACSGGIPRLINVIGNYILLTAYTEQTTDVGVEMVQDITGDLGLTPAPKRGDGATGKRALLRALGVASLPPQ